MEVTSLVSLLCKEEREVRTGPGKNCEDQLRVEVLGEGSRDRVQKSRLKACGRAWVLGFGKRNLKFRNFGVLGNSNFEN